MSQAFQDTANLILGESQNAIDPNAKSNTTSNSTANSNSTTTANPDTSTLNQIQIPVIPILAPPDSIYQALIYSIGDSIILFTGSCTPNTENLVHSYYNLDPNNNISLNTSCLLNTQFDLQIRNNIISVFNYKLLDPSSLQKVTENINLTKIQNCIAQKIAKDNMNSTVSGLSKTVIYQFIDGCIQTDSENKEITSAFIKVNTPPKSHKFNLIVIVIVILILIAIVIYLIKN